MPSVQIYLEVIGAAPNGPTNIERSELNVTRDDAQSEERLGEILLSVVKARGVKTVMSAQLDTDQTRIYLRRCQVCHVPFIVPTNNPYTRFCPEHHVTYRVCSWCGRTTDDWELTRNHPICRYCWHDSSVCEHCGGHFPCGDLFITRGGHNLCSECYEEEDIVEYRENPIREYHHNPDYHFLGTPSEMPELYLGVELETDGYYNQGSASDALFELSNEEDLFWQCEDSSLRNGIEIISHPATLHFHLNEMPWAKIVKTVAKFGGKSHNTSTCGLHVHATRRFLGENNDDITLNSLKLLYIIDYFWDNWASFSRRDEESLREFAQRYDDETHFKLKLEGDDPKSQAFKQKVYHEWNKMYNRDRHMALNVWHPATLEFRLPKGTLKLDTLFATIETVDFLMRFVKSHTIQQVYRLTWGKLIAQINEKKYPHVKPYLKERGLYKRRCASSLQSQQATSSPAIRSSRKRGNATATASG